MNNIKQKNKSVVRIAETPISLSSNETEKYLRKVIRESSSLLEKLSAFPKINDYRKLIK
ncbi:MAG TPA: hypothetical protein VNM69_15645 [Bacillus sp. (in: firmicutes)]|uniref:hypothetical protein n=1 Tax=Bacillus litorisediminis TaxID=2922713 RepID=UPI001FB04858|nr:hypothetical protein [Bacillus litorisediminis]HWO77302.1 hypothetical protein [Bacillus sp. (in: firmicutes)]